MKKIVSSFQPVYFAWVMATGIVSLAAQELKLHGLANVLSYFNLGAYLLCVLLLAGRAVMQPRAVWQDLTSHAKGPLFLALVPATCLLGNQFLELQHNQAVARTLWVVGAVAWALLLYAMLMGTSIGQEKPGLEKGFTGGWLLLVVASQSVAVLGAKLLGSWAGPAEVGALGLLSLFLLGAVLYVVLITVLFYRLTFVRLEGEEVGAAYWISVGASAITVLAGTALLKAMAQAGVFPDLQPFVKGLSLLFWGLSTWWLPIVTGLRLWSHLQTRPAFTYSPAYWSMVFPLGMYTLATLKLSEALPLPALRVVPTYFFYVALLAWGLTFAGMLLSLIKPAKAPK